MSQKEKEQLQAELSILKELKHPNIVQYFERDHLKNTLDLHLGQVIKGYKSRAERVPEDFVWSVFTQLVTALYRCHYGSDPPDAGRNVLGHFRNDTKAFITKKSTQYVIIHRDLKPENGMCRC
jgi:serine/threonine protein kinase